MTRTAEILFLTALTTIVLMFALQPIARNVGLVDKPGGRKAHEGEIPVIGGLAMMFGVVVGTLGSAYVSANHGYLLASLILLVVVGAIDDRFELPASVRLLAQLVAVFLMVYGAEQQVSNIGRAFFDGVVNLGWFSVPFTTLILLTAINAFNMFDGSDGIAGAQALIGLVFLYVACFLGGSTAELPFIASLIGSLCGFLLFNWPSKRTRNVRAFMGDAGSTLLGFSLAWLCVGVSQKPVDAAISPVVTLWIFALPIYDFFSNMIRRTVRGHSPFRADSEHLHHLLKRFGFSSRRVAQLILFASAVLAAFGLGGHFRGVGDGILFFSWLALGVIYFVVFGSGLVIRRRSELRIEPLVTDKANDFIRP